MSTPVSQLREQLLSHDLHGFLIPRADQYQGEYIPENEERLARISSFTGSAGLAVVLREHAAVLVDGRYTIQVREQVDTEIFDPLPFPESNLHTWLTSHLQAGQKLAYDPRLHTQAHVDTLTAKLAEHDIELVPVHDNLIDATWDDRPTPPLAPITPHPVQYSGEETPSKLEKLRQALELHDYDATLLSAPESVAWLLNVRGGDVSFTPLPLSRALITQKIAELFVDPRKLPQDTLDYLAKIHVKVRHEDELDQALAALPSQHIDAILIDARRASSHHVTIAKDAGLSVHIADDLTALPRATKNDTEQQGTRDAHLRDGVAISRFLCWLDHQMAQGASLDEITAAEKLLEFRKESKHFRDSSFPSISGFGPNGAIVHYRASPDTNLRFSPDSLYLIDSGAQYPDGTTDITRTVAIGTPTDEMKRAFTLVLRGMIGVSCMHFPQGITGHALDIIARAPLWSAGLDYAHGTGHGVGSYLGVHEGPQNISPYPNTTALLPGMILSNEPGYYKAGAFGIRIENLIMVKPPHTPEGGEREVLSFETLTIAPIDRRVIETSMLSDREIAWLDTYHARVRESLMPGMTSEQERTWLTQATAPLKTS